MTAFFDGLSNTNELGISADGTADKKSKEFCFVVLRHYARKFAFRTPDGRIYNILIYELALTC